MIVAQVEEDGGGSRRLRVDKPYEAYDPETLILRDHLAIDRTILANERTFLAYVRTALAFLVVGGTLLKFFDKTAAHVAGGGCVAVAIGLAAFGILRYSGMNANIRRARR